MAVVEIVGNAARDGDDADATEGSLGVTVSEAVLVLGGDVTYTVKAIDASRATMPHLKALDHSWGFSASPLGSKVTITKSFVALPLLRSRSESVSLPS